MSQVRTSIVIELPLPLTVYEEGLFDMPAVMEYSHSLEAKRALLRAVMHGDYAVDEVFVDD